VPRASHHVLRILHHVPHTSHFIPHTMYHVPRTHARHAKKGTSIEFVSYLKHACIYKAELILFLCKIGARGMQPPPAPLMAGGFWPNRLPCCVHHFHLCLCPPSRPNKCTPYHVPRISYLVPRTSNFVPCTTHHAPCIWHITPHISFIISMAEIPTVTSLKTWF
jgi:hypothetical protein